ncbi:MAG TPA: hypothetical protein VIM41_00240 [Gammaproteobacteria bacterium]
MQSDSDPVRIQTCVSLLEQHRHLHLLSCGTSVASMLALLMMLITSTDTLVWLMVLAVVILLGVYETFLAVRIGFDTDLLHRLASHGSVTDKELRALDEALSYFKLRPESKAGRPLEKRLAGSLALFKQQAWVCGFQLIPLLCAAGIHAVKASLA